MDERLLTLVARRLNESDLDDDAGLLVLAACEGDAALTEAVAGEAPELTEPVAPEGDVEPPEPAGAYLASIGAEGFRGVGDARTLELRPGPGLTLVVGRNGSGKSSFVEALEVALTGDSLRWSARKEVAWRDGWRNLHHPDPTTVSATFAVDGDNKATVVTRAWSDRADLDAGVTSAQAHGQPKATLDSLGWADAVVAARPILSYNELGSILDEGPSHLYDAIAGLLGLEDITDAVKRLSATRLALKKTVEGLKSEAKEFVRALDDLDDERATECSALLGTKQWDLDAVAAIVTGTAAAESAGTDLDLLRGFAQLTGPDADVVATAIERARAAADERDAVAGTDAEAADRTAALLRAALDHHDHTGDASCPVCGVGSLDRAWADQTTAEVERLDRIAREARHAAQAVRDASQRLASLRVLPQVSLPDATRLELDADAARQAWERWLEVDATDLRAGADAFEALAPELDAALGALRASAQAAYEEREDRWQPIATSVAGWVERARPAQAADRARPNVEKAEKWLKAAIEDLQAERLRPIAAQASTVWDELSQQSNVTLGPITLTGSGPKRRVNLDVSVDGQPSVALSVMSQGELHALALAIFLPRATRPDSPFRFLVIDDPVQAMDPAKVDGLARVLQRTAERRQVVVFTHDDRLPAAVRRLGIEATVLQVTRRDQSVVEIREVADPASVYVDDAFAIALTEDLPDDAKRRVVPGYGRHALEAAFNDVIRRKLLGSGVGHEEVEDQINAVTTLTMRAALALFGDAQRGGDVLTRLNGFGHWAADAYQACNKGAHDSYAGDLEALVRDVKSLVAKIRTVP